MAERPAGGNRIGAIAPDSAAALRHAGRRGAQGRRGADGMRPDIIHDTAILGAQQAVDDLMRVVRGRPDYARLRVLQVLRAKHNRAVFAVRFGGERAVLKRFIMPGAAETVRALEAELAHLSGHMAEGRLRIVRCLHADPELGLAVMSHAPGRRLAEVLAFASPVRRARLLRQVGEWALAYSAGRTRAATFGPRLWLQQCRALDLSHLDAPARARMEALAEALQARVRAHQGRLVTQGAIHGDLTPANLHLHAGVLYGVDVKGACWLAAARDVARFAVWMASRTDLGDRPRLYGVDRADLEALLDAGLLPAEEYDTVLPFFVGERLFHALADPTRRTDEATRLLAAVDGFVASPVAP
jgi:hypothetical protein